MTTHQCSSPLPRIRVAEAVVYSAASLRFTEVKHTLTVADSFLHRSEGVVDCQPAIPPK
jgi:hypothetical protein